MKNLFLVSLFLIPVFCSFSKGDDKEIKKYTRIVNAWNKAHNEWQFDKLSRLYAAKVLFYCNFVDKSECIKNKTTQVSPSRIFAQKIISDIEVRPFGDKLTICRFIKEVSTNDGVKEYPAYLVLKSFGDELRIVAESDVETDHNVNFTLSPEIFDNPGKLPNTTVKERSSDSGLGLPFYSITSIAAIAIIAFAARARRKRKAFEFSQHSQPPSVTNSAQVKEEPKKEQFTNKEKGDLFEAFVINKFDTNYFRITEKPDDRTFNGIASEQRQNPDFVVKFELRGYEAKFAVECTFCSTVKDIIDVKSWDKLNRYKEFGRERQIDVYIILGLGGVPQNPKELFIIPLPKAKAKMSYDDLKLYNRSTVNRLFFDRDTCRLT